MQYELNYTNDYGMFKKLDGNRSVDRKRIDRVKDSMLLTGLKCVPILVNEKYEVCEGQARLSAYKELGLPVPYIVQEGFTINDAISLNISTTTWKTEDYIRSYAEQGNEDYKFLLMLGEKYSCIPLVTIVKLVCGVIGDHGVLKKVQSGEIKVNITERIIIEKKVKWVAELTPFFSRLKGRKTSWMQALGFCYDCPQVDNDRLAEKVSEQSSSFRPAVNAETAIEQLEDAYNDHARGRRVYISHLFVEYIDARMRGHRC